jgi:diacylglycerol kinase
MRLVSDFFSSRARSFRFAFAGWWHVIHTQRNAWIHALASVLALVLAAWLGLSPRDWAILLLTIALVWTAEFINTAIEAIVDLVSPTVHPLAKVGKDVGAAAVLIAALTSILVGILLMGPPLILRIQALLKSTSP